MGGRGAELCGRAPFLPLLLLIELSWVSAGDYCSTTEEAVKTITTLRFLGHCYSIIDATLHCIELIINVLLLYIHLLFFVLLWPVLIKFTIHLWQNVKTDKKILIKTVVLISPWLSLNELSWIKKEKNKANILLKILPLVEFLTTSVSYVWNVIKLFISQTRRMGKTLYLAVNTHF